MSYQAAWGHKGTRFIGRVYEMQEDYEEEVWRCAHAHRTQAEARECARTHIEEENLLDSATCTAEEDAEGNERRKQQILADIGPQSDPALAVMADSVAEVFSQLGVEGIEWA